MNELQKRIDELEKQLAEERKEFADAIDNRIEFEMKATKGQISQKIRNYFLNVGQAKNLPDSLELCDFLRIEFANLEKTLNKIGIKTD